MDEINCGLTSLLFSKEILSIIKLNREFSLDDMMESTPTTIELYKDKIVSAFYTYSLMYYYVSNNLYDDARELFSKLKRANASALKLNGGIFGECQVDTFDRRISP